MSRIAIYGGSGSGGSDAYLPLSGGALTGAVTTSRTEFSEQELVTKKYVDDNNTSITVDSALSSTSENPVQNKVINEALTSKLSVSGGALTGALTTSKTDFTDDQEFVTKKYVDDNTGGGGGTTGDYMPLTGTTLDGKNFTLKTGVYDAGPEIYNYLKTNTDVSGNGYTNIKIGTNNGWRGSGVELVIGGEGTDDNGMSYSYVGLGAGEYGSSPAFFRFDANRLNQYHGSRMGAGNLSISYTDGSGNTLLGSNDTIIELMRDGSTGNKYGETILNYNGLFTFNSNGAHDTVVTGEFIGVGASLAPYGQDFIAKLSNKELVVGSKSYTSNNSYFSVNNSARTIEFVDMPGGDYGTNRAYHFKASAKDNTTLGLTNSLVFTAAPGATGGSDDPGYVFDAKVRSTQTSFAHDQDLVTKKYVDEAIAAAIAALS